MNEPPARWPAGALIGGILVLGFWQAMAYWSARPHRAFALQAADFEEFQPASPGWEIRRIPIAAGDIEPNILAFLLHTAAGTAHLRGPSPSDTPACPRPHTATLRHSDTPPPRSSVLVRLAHGYNMADCMRIKGYTVELVGEVKGGPVPGESEADIECRITNVEGRNEAAEGKAGVESGMLKADGGRTERSSTSNIPHSTFHVQRPASRQGPDGIIRDPASSSRVLPACQVWRLTSTLGERAIWVTSLLRSDDFKDVERDVRSLPFPRVGIPDEADWNPQGLTWASLRHPIRNLRQYLRARWNGSRCDWATFLRLRQPAWASGELLTLVSAWQGAPVGEGEEEAATEAVLAAHAAMQAALRAWGQRHTPAGE